MAGGFEIDESANELGSVISVTCLDIDLGKDTAHKTVGKAKYGVLNHAVNILYWFLSSCNEQQPQQQYTTSHFSCFRTKTAIFSSLKSLFLFLCRF